MSENIEKQNRIPPLGANDKYVMAKVPQELDREARASLADENDDITTKIEQLEQEAKDAAGAFRKQVKELKAKRREKVEERRTGKRLVEMQCVERTEFPNGKAIYFPHPDVPGALKISEMPLSAEELREPPLFEAGGGDDGGDGDGGPTGSAKPKGGKRTKKPGAGAAPPATH